MFTKGQLIFAALFVITFIIGITLTYKRDLKNLKTHYKGAYKIVLGFVLFVLLLFVIKGFLKS